MAVLGPLSFTLDVPDVATGLKFYIDAGLTADVQGNVARFRCPGQDRDSIVLLGGFARKRLHHISLRAEDLDGMAKAVVEHGGELGSAPEGFEDNGLWVRDPHGMVIHLSERPADPALEAGAPFQINATLVRPQGVDMRSLYGAELALVRPDQVVAWRGARWDVAALDHAVGADALSLAT